MKKYLIGLIVFAAQIVSSFANADETKLNYIAAVRPDFAALCVAYDMFTVEDVLGAKGLKLSGRTLAGFPNTGGSVTGGGDLALSKRIGKSGDFDAYASGGIGVLFVAGKRPGPCLTLGVKMYTQPSPAASYGYKRL